MIKIQIVSLIYVMRMLVVLIVQVQDHNMMMVVNALKVQAATLDIVTQY